MNDLPVDSGREKEMIFFLLRFPLAEIQFPIFIVCMVSYMSSDFRPAACRDTASGRHDLHIGGYAIFNNELQGTGKQECCKNQQ